MRDTNSFGKGNIMIMGTPEGEKREKGAEKLFKDITGEDFPNMVKELDIQIYEAKKIPDYLNAKDLLQDTLY